MILLNKWRCDAHYRSAFPCGKSKRWSENRWMFDYKELDVPAARKARLLFETDRDQRLIGWKKVYRMVRRTLNMNPVPEKVLREWQRGEAVLDANPQT